jgi:hypothetical protein
MTNKMPKEVLERLESCPASTDAARVLIEMEQQDSNPIRLTEAQIAEVDRRRANPRRKLVTLEQVRRQFSFRRA